MLSRNLEQTLHRALGLATDRKHEYATLEHLRLGLTDDTDAANHQARSAHALAGVAAVRLGRWRYGAARSARRWCGRAAARPAQSHTSPRARLPPPPQSA